MSHAPDVNKSHHPPPDLRRVLDSHRVVVCVGSGGVGKTTTSAALAVHAAAQGRRVLCLTIDPARRLAQSLGLSELRGSEQQVSPELFASYGLTLRGSLSAMMLDMKRTFDDLVSGQAASSAQRERILNNRLYQYVSTSLAGTQEYMAMEKLHAVRHDERFDLIVLDTPPTTNALDFLDAPQKLVGAIDSPVMRWFVDTLDSSKGFSLVSRSAAFVLKNLGRFTGAEFLTQVGQFVTELNSLFGGFRDRARAVYEDLKSKDVAFVIVTSPSPLTVAEAIYFTRKLREYGVEPKAMVVNRVHHAPQLDPDDDMAPDQLAAFLASRGAAVDAENLWRRMLTAAEDALVQARRDLQGLRRLRKSMGADLPYVEVPAFDRDVHELGSLARLSTYLVGAGAR
ncbi:MAG TPA: ArsA-related P-loop ATPase [Polyangiales bacterium]|nr:ArsA-related P-loop ATPase [Polyangiales bacterium]